MDIRRRKILDEALIDLSVSDPSVYYLSTAEIADRLTDHIQTMERENKMEPDKLEKIKHLSTEEIQYILSFHEHYPESRA